MRMNEVFETIAEIFEELRSESGEREYSVQTKESEKADNHRLFKVAICDFKR